MLKLVTIITAALLLAGCGLTPKQLQALDGAMCTKIYGATTTIVGGASKSSGVVINGENCSIATQGKAP